MGRIIKAILSLAITFTPIIYAQDKQAAKSPSEVVKAFLQDPEPDFSSLLFNQPQDPNFATEFVKVRKSRGAQVEILFEIKDGMTAVVGTASRSERYRRGIDIDPVFLVNKNGWKILLVFTPDELEELLRSFPPETAQKVRALNTQFDQKSEEIYAAVAKQRATQLEITPKNVQGLWYKMADKKISVVNLEPNGQFVTASISDGKLHDRRSGKWEINDRKLVLTDAGEGPVRRYMIEKSTIDRLVLVDESSSATKTTLEKDTALLRIFPALRAGGDSTKK